MRRLLGFVFRLAILMALAAWLAEAPGAARIVWRGTVIETSAALLAVGALAVAWLLHTLFRAWHLIRHGHRTWRLERSLRDMKRGQEMLARGLAAIAGGDAAEAGRLAVGTRKLLGGGAASQLLQAQAAQLAGDHAAARSLYRALTEDPDSAVIGYRGLIMDARRRGEYAEVVALADELQALKPGTPWLNLVRFDIAVREKDWEQAGRALAAPEAGRLIGKEKAARLRAAMLLIRAEEEARQGRTEPALQAAEQAAGQARDWLPAIIGLARAQKAAGQNRAANRTVERNWPRMPHPHLAAIYRDGDDPVEGYRRMRHLVRADEAAPASRLALAEAALEADLWGEARRHLMTLIGQGGATQAAFRLMARLERRESGDEQAALQWLTKAADAPADPAWLCASCGAARKEWQAVCASCESFATLEWQSPGVARRASETQPDFARHVLDSRIEE